MRFTTANNTQTIGAFHVPSSRENTVPKLYLTALKDVSSGIDAGVGSIDRDDAPSAPRFLVCYTRLRDIKRAITGS